MNKTPKKPPPRRYMKRDPGLTHESALGVTVPTVLPYCRNGPLSSTDSAMEAMTVTVRESIQEWNREALPSSLLEKSLEAFNALPKDEKLSWRKHPRRAKLGPNPYHLPFDRHGVPMDQRGQHHSFYAHPHPLFDRYVPGSQPKILPIFRVDPLSSEESAVVLSASHGILVVLLERQDVVLKLFASGTRSLAKFRRERSAYEALFSSESRHVPKCFGTFIIPSFRESQLFNLIPVEQHRKLRRYKTCYGLALEHIPGQSLTQGPVNAEIIEDVLHALCGLHQGAITHRDIDPRSFIRRPTGDVVLVGFSCAGVEPHLANPLTFRRELRRTYEMICGFMVPDERLGIQRQRLGIDHAELYAFDD